MAQEQPPQQFKLFSEVTRLLKSHFFAGMLVLIPFGVIAWIVVWVATLVWRLHGLFPESWMPEAVVEGSPVNKLVKLAFTFGALLVLSLAVSMLGWASKNYVGRKLLHLVGDLIGKIPVLRSVYSALDQLLRTISAGGGQQFSHVVYIEYPRKGIWTLAFVTGPAKGPAVPPNHLNVYVPTTPNPTSGFFLIVPENEIRESHLRVEDAFKNILSLGIAQSDGATHG